MPASAAELVSARRERRWAALGEALDWTRYHLQVVLVEHGSAGRSRVAAGLFERMAQFHSCAGALPMEAATTGGDVAPLDDSVIERLELTGQWADRYVEEIDADGLGFYDVVVCVDSRAREVLEAQHSAKGAGELPAHVVDLGDFGAYLDERRVESPIKAWVPDWRQVVDPEYDERQAAAKPPRDDALGVWYSMPEDLASLVQSRYESASSTLSAAEMSAQDGRYGGDDDAAVMAFHLAGLVRYLMDSYPLDLHGGPGYIEM